MECFKTILLPTFTWQILLREILYSVAYLKSLNYTSLIEPETFKNISMLKPHPEILLSRR